MARGLCSKTQLVGYLSIVCRSAESVPGRFHVSPGLCRPSTHIYGWKADEGRSHVLSCMLPGGISQHMHVHVHTYDHSICSCAAAACQGGATAFSYDRARHSMIVTVTAFSM